MENYIVRIYRYEKDNPRRLIGTVEEVGFDGKKAFTNVDELWGILNLSLAQRGPANPKPTAVNQEPQKKG
jgi:hypothetical protein